MSLSSVSSVAPLSSSVQADPVLRVQHLRVGHAGAPPLLPDWHTALPAGLALLEGDTGTGKSTVLRVLAGEALPQAGELHLLGAHLHARSSANERADWRRQVFYVDPTTEAFHDMDVRECVRHLSAGDAGFDPARWAALAEAFGLNPHLEKKLRMLSTGSRRKVWLACALASRCPLVLLDEPAAALDAGSVRALYAALAEEAQAQAQGARPPRVTLLATYGPVADLPWRARYFLPEQG